MKKQNIIDYFNSIKDYLNLSALCNAYNEKYPNNSIDYNNLRLTLNYKATNRLSEEKLNAFYDFLTKDIFQDNFKVNSNAICSSEIEEIIHTKTEEIRVQIAEVLKHGFSNKQ